MAVDLTEIEGVETAQVSMVRREDPANRNSDIRVTIRFDYTRTFGSQGRMGEKQSIQGVLTTKLKD